MRGFVCGVVLLAFGLAASAAGALAPVASLSAPGTSGGVYAVAASGSTVVALGSAAYVFSEPAGGWVSERQASTLSDSQGVSIDPTGVAVSGRTVVLNEYLGPYGVPFESVFVEPAGGWSGTVPEAAHLVASDGAYLGAPEISGATVVASGTHGGVHSVYVFVAPPGGWSGTVREVARLSDPRGLSLTDVALSGSTIVAGGQTGLDAFGGPGFRSDVFLEPPAGWSSTLGPAATLVGPFGPGASGAISGRTVLAGFDLFTEPTHGWSGPVTPAASLNPVFPDGSSTVCCEALSGATAAISSYRLASEHQCPCQGTIWVFSRRGAVWSGPVIARPAGTVTSITGPVGLAIAGQYLFTGGSDAIEVYKLTGSYGHVAAPTTVLRLTASGLAKGRPRLRFTLIAGAANAPISAVTVKLPHGLALRQNPKRLRAAISVNATTNYAIAIVHRTLLIRLARSSKRLSVTIGAAGLRESAQLRQRITARARDRRATRLALALTATVNWGVAQPLTGSFTAH